MQFQNHKGELKVFSRNGILHELGIHDEDLDALETIHKILQKLPPDTTILFDETDKSQRLTLRIQKIYFIFYKNK